MFGSLGGCGGFRHTGEFVRVLRWMGETHGLRFRSRRKVCIGYNVNQFEAVCRALVH
jgi:hypothetical protein